MMREKYIWIFGFCCVLVCACSVFGNIVINEVHYEPEDNTRRLEFIELYNSGTAAVSLTGWEFSEGITYTFLPGATIPAGGYAVVAENPTEFNNHFGTSAYGPWSGRLDNDGEQIELKDASGIVIDTVDYKLGFPWPTATGGDGASMELLNPGIDNDLGGSWRASGSDSSNAVTPTVFIPSQSSSWRYRKGQSEASTPMFAWRLLDFSEDTTWLSGRTSIGYGDGDDITVLSDMMNSYNTVYLRHTFVIGDAGDIPRKLTLDVYTDDGCIVWINGVEIARRHVTAGDKYYNSTAENHEAVWETIEIDAADSFLVAGTNCVAVHGLNTRIGSSDFSIDLELREIVTRVLPTPGKQNSVYTPAVPPQIRQVNHTPQQALAAEPVIVTAKITDPDVVGTVELAYQVVVPGQYIPAYIAKTTAQLLASPLSPRAINPAYTDPANWTVIEMRDDGTGNDGIAGDAVFTAAISGQVNRTLIRYVIRASDTLGNTVQVPYPDDGALNFAYYVYNGVPAYVAATRSVLGVPHTYSVPVMTSMPVYALLIEKDDFDQAVAYDSADQIPSYNYDARSAFNWSGTFVYNGIAYDNIGFRLRQRNDRYGGHGKRSMRFRFNRSHHIQLHDIWGRPYKTKWRTINMGKMVAAGGANFGLVETMNQVFWNMFGVPAPYTHWCHFRVVKGAEEAPAGANGQYYGDFFGMYLAMEDYDTKFIKAHDMPDGNLYKLKSYITDGTQLQRHQGENAVTGGEDFHNIMFNLLPERDTNWLNTYVNYDAWNHYHVIATAIRHFDYAPNRTEHIKNRAWFFEPASDNNMGRMRTLPWDADTCWGPNWGYGEDFAKQAIFGYWDESTAQYENPRYEKPAFMLEYRNVMREFRGLAWQEDVIKPMLDDFGARISAFAYADRDRWRSAPADAGYQDDGSMAVKLQDMKNFAFTGGSWFNSQNNGPGDALTRSSGRDAYLDEICNSEGDQTTMPAKPVVTALSAPEYRYDDLQFECSAFSDPQGAETFAALQWRLGAVTDTDSPRYTSNEPRKWELEPVWESEELTTFTNRITIPAVGLNIHDFYRVRARMKDTSGRWSFWSDPVQFKVNPVTAAQKLRISEIMYHPAEPLAGSIYVDNDFEFIELYNAGSEPVNPAGVAFVDGISYNFEPGTGNIGTNECIVLVRNLPAFATRYDTNSITILGEYGGKLDNSGEQLEVLDALNTKIQGFSYSDTLYPSTDGDGYSLVSADLFADTNMWDQPAGWRPSDVLHGTPGEVSTIPEPVTVAAFVFIIALGGACFYNKGERYEESKTT